MLPTFLEQLLSLPQPHFLTYSHKIATNLNSIFEKAESLFVVTIYGMKDLLTARTFNVQIFRASHGGPGGAWRRGGWCSCVVSITIELPTNKL